jgi:hypothetical protein
MRAGEGPCHFSMSTPPWWIAALAMLPLICISDAFESVASSSLRRRERSSSGDPEDVAD